MGYPERYHPVHYDIGPDSKGIYEVFEDPDFIDLQYSLPHQKVSISWATGSTAVEAADTFDRFITWKDTKKGNLLLGRRLQDSITGKSTNALRGESSDILDEVRENSERVIGFFVANRTMRFNWQPAFPKIYHDIKTAEVEVTFEKKSKHAREIIEACIAQTAMSGLLSVSEQTLDHFSQYIPSLERR